MKGFLEVQKGKRKGKGFSENLKKEKGKGKEILEIRERIKGFVKELRKKDP